MRYLHFVCLAVALFLAGCNQSVRDGYKISPPPTENEDTLFEASITALSDAIRSNPSVSENYYKRAFIYFENKKYEDAYKDIDRATKLNSTNAAYLLLKSQLLLEQGKLDEAWQLINQVESYKVESVDFYLTKAKLSIYKKDTIAVKTALRQLRKSSPYDSDLFLTEGKYLAQLERDTLAAMQAYHQSIKLDRNNEEPYDLIVDYLSKHNQVDSALAIVNLAQVVFTNGTKWKAKQAEILKSQSLYEQAWLVYNRILESDSANTEALESMANIRILQNGYTAALKHLNDVIKLNPRNANYFYLAGFCHEKLRNFTEAQSNYIKAVRIKPDLQAAVQGQERTTRILNRAIGLNY